MSWLELIEMLVFFFGLLCVIIIPIENWERKKEKKGGELIAKQK